LGAGGAHRGGEEVCKREKKVFVEDKKGENYKDNGPGEVTRPGKGKALVKGRKIGGSAGNSVGGRERGGKDGRNL